MKDTKNLHYSRSEETTFRPDGQLVNFELMKFAPKIDEIRRRLGDSPDLRILDVGVGYGAWLYLLEKRGYRCLFGMDPFPESLDIAARHSGAQLVEGRIEDEHWPYEPESFDVVTCFEVVEHLREPRLFFSRARQYLRPGGLMILTTPNRSLFYAMRRLPRIGISDTNPTHINVRRPRYWLRLAREEGYDIVRKWYGESMAHIHYLPGIFEGLQRRWGWDLARTWIFRGLQQSLCLSLRRP